MTETPIEFQHKFEILLTRNYPFSTNFSDSD